MNADALLLETVTHPVPPPYFPALRALSRACGRAVTDLFA
jgi:hypothetical protein